MLQKIVNEFGKKLPILRVVWLALWSALQNVILKFEGCGYAKGFCKAKYMSFVTKHEAKAT